MTESYPHLTFQREEPVTERRTHGGFPSRKPPEDPSAHARSLQNSLEKAKTQTDTDVGGFDERRLFRFTAAKGFDPDSLIRISDQIELVSQETDEVLVAFVTHEALAAFESRLASMVIGERITYPQLIYALQGFDGWRKEDRMGWALKRDGLPKDAPFVVDVELWPLENRPDERERLWHAFEEWLAQQGIQWLDRVKQEGLSLYRLRCDHAQTEHLLRHRDIRTVDLPPRFGLDVHLLSADIQNLPPIYPPPDNAPGVVVLDSGLSSGHPLLAPAVGDAQSFLPGIGADDENGHGTHVAGIALYGDMESCLENGRFITELRLFSGRILDENSEYDPHFIENHLADAVRYFSKEYGCKVFNLSIGDQNKPYLGGHIRGLAYTLDTLARELDVLFVVSAGNTSRSQLTGLQWKEQYPHYLTQDEWALLDPAPALNALTVGSLARYDQTLNSRRHQDDANEIPIARRDQPSPFSCRGPAAGGAIKPDLVAYGGNWAVNVRAGANYLVPGSGLGELSTSRDFMRGRLLAEDSGTSMAAPHVSHLAARLLVEQPQADNNLIRALLLAHAHTPETCEDLLTDRETLRRICGYGCVNPRCLFRSLETEVTIIAQSRIANRRHHFYEIPIPDEFVAHGRRLREISVGMAYTPYVRSTRMAYKATRIDFRLISSPDLNTVTATFNNAADRKEYELIPELKTPDVNSQLRGKGTVQAATWRFRRFSKDSFLRKNRLFVVITRNDFPWGEANSATEEPYALVVCLRDRENEQARLYTQLRARLQARARARAQV